MGLSIPQTPTARNSIAGISNIDAGSLTDAGGLAADQLASAFCCAPFDSNRYAVNRDGITGGNDFVDAVWFSSGVELWTVDFISKPCDRAAMNILVGRAADDGSAVIGLVADGDDFQGHVVLLEVVDVSRSGGRPAPARSRH